MGSYVRPTTTEAALDALAAGLHEGRGLAIVAGATDHYPARVIHTRDEDVLDISGLADGGYIRPVQGGWWVPAGATWTEVIEADLPPRFDGLVRAARSIGGVQIQNRATVVGNVCNASPAADATPNLLVLDADVVLASVRGERRVPVSEFVTGNRSTVRAADELVTGLFVPGGPGGAAAHAGSGVLAAENDTRSTFLKLGSRAYLVISIAMVAAVLARDGTGRISDARVAVGACSPIAQRLGSLERALLGLAAKPGIGTAVRPEHLAGLTPIDDVRATATYRREAAEVLVRRVLEELVA